jgi:hypothetical protein
LKYSNEEIICSIGERIFYQGNFDENKLNFDNGNQIFILRKRFRDYFLFSRRISYIKNNKQIYADFLCKKLNGVWEISIEKATYTFKIKRGYRIDIWNSESLICIIDLKDRDIRRSEEWYYYYFKCSLLFDLEEIVALSITFMRLYILILDTEGTRLPASIGNIGC